MLGGVGWGGVWVSATLDSLPAKPRFTCVFENLVFPERESRVPARRCGTLAGTLDSAFGNTEFPKLRPPPQT